MALSALGVTGDLAEEEHTWWGVSLGLGRRTTLTRGSPPRHSTGAVSGNTDEYKAYHHAGKAARV